MWYIIEENKIKMAPINKKLQDGKTIINFNKNEQLLKQHGYKKYDGEKTISELKIVNDQIVEKTAQQIEIEYKERKDNLFKNYYKQNPDLVICVKQYKELLDKFKLPYNAKTYDISAAITSAENMSDIEKINLGFTATTLWNNIVLNIQSLNIKNPMSYAWENMPKLIEYLPAQ